MLAARALRDVTREARALFVINGDVALAHAMVVASHPTRSSKSRVKRDPLRAKGTPSVRTPWSGQRTRRRSARTSRRHQPRSKCRHDEETGRVSWRALVVNSHFGQCSFRLRGLTVTTTLAGRNSTAETVTPDRSSRRLNAVLTRTGSGLLGSVCFAAPNLRTARACHADGVGHAGRRSSRVGPPRNGHGSPDELPAPRPCPTRTIDASSRENTHIHAGRPSKSTSGRRTRRSTATSRS